MSCPPNYDFFKNIETYIKEEKKIVNSTPSTKVPDDCDKFSNLHRLGNQEKAKSLCISFAKLNQFLVALQTQNDDKCNFLNYWFNSELSQTWFSKNDSISDVYVGMESYLYENNDYNSLNCNKLCNINNDELNKMKKLYNLYDNYSKLNTIINSTSAKNKQEILTLSTECCTDYSDVSYICNPVINNNNHMFCEKLNDFKSKYEALYQKVDEKRSEISNNFIKLEECPNTKIISTAVTGTVVGLIPLMGVLYKFTPMGQMFRSKIGILNKDISNNDEEMIKMSLMEKENEPIRFQKGTYNIKYQSL